MNEASPGSLILSMPALDRLMPMHLVVGPTGHISHVGPTLAKVAPGPMRGRRFLEVFEVRRPRSLNSASELATRDGGHLQLAFRGGPRLAMKGQALVAGGGALIVDLSFGISVVEAIAHYGLAGTDFAPTDLSVEMLYLAEARETVMREVTRLNERLELARLEAEKMALSDMLTGLANRRAMDDMMARFIARGDRFALMNVDLDYFKDVNDTLGHAAGDAVLAQVGKVLRGAARADDCVARVGGDEFALLLRGLTDPARIEIVGRRIIAGLEQPIPFGNRTCRISASIGVTTSDRYSAPQAEVMLADADQALYESKRNGRAMVTVFGEPARPVQPGASDVMRAG